MDNTPVLVDSNVFISYLRARKDPAIELMKLYDSTRLVTCGVVKAEVLRGVKSLRVRRGLEEFFNIMRFVETSHSLWDETLEIAWQLDRKGRVLPLADICIAACALSSGSAVFTNDKHFEHFPELMVLKPE